MPVTTAKFVTLLQRFWGSWRTTNIKVRNW
jgi:hypothetical protein